MSWLVDESVSGNQPLMSALRSTNGERYVSTTGGSLGWGIGAACGIALARNGEPVTCVLGDGAFFFGVQALWPAVSMNLPITFVVLDNGGFDSTRWFESRYAKSHSRGSEEARFVGSNFASLGRSVCEVARGFGLQAHDVVDRALAETLAKFRGTGPVVLRVPLDSEFNRS